MIRIALYIVLVVGVYTFPWFQERIPNGDKVPDPCAGQSGIWRGVGHDREPGGGPRNQFGQDFKAAGFEWTKELCTKDSDQDGMTNGEELGDKECTWTKGSKPAADATRHPGICEPVDDAKCVSINKNIKCS